jgi:hypothetical protein
MSVGGTEARWRGKACKEVCAGHSCVEDTSGIRVVE